MRRRSSRRVTLPCGQIQEQPRKGLGVFDLSEPRHDLVNPPAHELELFVRLRACLAALDALGGEEMHALSAEARCRVERGELAPGPARQSGLLLELAASAVERSLALFERSRRELE